MILTASAGRTVQTFPKSSSPLIQPLCTLFSLCASERLWHSFFVLGNVWSGAFINCAAAACEQISMCAQRCFPGHPIRAATLNWCERGEGEAVRQALHLASLFLPLSLRNSATLLLNRSLQASCLIYAATFLPSPEMQLERKNPCGGSLGEGEGGCRW